jgi:hypothetical protein
MHLGELPAPRADEATTSGGRTGPAARRQQRAQPLRGGLSAGRGSVPTCRVLRTITPPVPQPEGWEEKETHRGVALAATQEGRSDANSGWLPRHWATWNSPSHVDGEGHSAPAELFTRVLVETIATRGSCQATTSFFLRLSRSPQGNEACRTVGEGVQRGTVAEGCWRPGLARCSAPRAMSRRPGLWLSMLRKEGRFRRA